MSALPFRHIQYNRIARSEATPGQRDQHDSGTEGNGKTEESNLMCMEHGCRISLCRAAKDSTSG